MALQPGRRDRWMAFGLLLAAVAVLYLLVVHPLLVKPLQALDAEIARLQERRQRIDLQLKQAPQVAERLQQALQLLTAQPGFMPEGSVELATSQLVQRLEAAVREASPDGRSCAISDRSPMQADTSGRFVRVVVQVRLRCGMDEWMRVLQSLESGAQQLSMRRVDILSLAGAPDGGNGLDVTFELSGFLRPTPAGVVLEVTRAQ